MISIKNTAQVVEFFTRGTFTTASHHWKLSVDFRGKNLQLCMFLTSNIPDTSETRPVRSALKDAACLLGFICFLCVSSSGSDAS